MNMNEYKITISGYLYLKDVVLDFTPPINKFYGPSNAKVIAVVGKNGVGKSNVIDFIINKFRNYKSNQNHNWDVFFKDTELIYYAPKINDRIAGYHDIIGLHNVCEINKKLSLSSNYGFYNPNTKFENIKSYDENENLIYKLWYLVKTQNDVYNEMAITLEMPKVDHIAFLRKSNMKYIESEKVKFKLLFLFELAINSIGLSLNLFDEFIEAEDINSYLSKLRDFRLPNKLIVVNESLSEKIVKMFEQVLKSWFMIYDYFDKKKLLKNEGKIANKKYHENILNLYMPFIHTNFLIINVKYEADKTNFIMSSGDSEYFGFFGRVIYKITSLKASGQNDFFLLLDEIDISLHPERQLSLISNLLREINKILMPNNGESPDDNKLFIIITTHSPLITSDIANGNVVYLIKKGDFTVSQNPDFNAFANNIHNIYKNGFYLEKGLIGKFASEFIYEEIISIMYDNSNKNKIITLNENEREQLRIKINLIGEPIIKSRLLFDFDKAVK